jgi:hypothetical protein
MPFSHGKDAEIMSRSLTLATLAIALVVLPAAAVDPTPIEKQIVVQKAMASARQFLDVNMPADAITALEAEIANADGNKAFLTLLREAYLAELYRLEKAGNPDPTRSAQLRRNLSLLGADVPAAPKQTPPANSPTPARSELPPPSFDPPVLDSNAEAVAAFKKGQYVEAASLFAAIANPTADQKAAWAYCRIKIAVEKLNAPGCDPTMAEAITTDLTDALKLAPQHAELQKVVQQAITAAAQKAKACPAREPGESPNAIETASFTVRHSGNREVAESVAKAAETLRKAIFERWSGPPASAWNPRCEIVIHPTAEAYAKATSRPASSTGTTSVRLTNGRATERRIDLRADDTGIVPNALPRELTHVVLADLFPDKPAPKWAVEGMAILASSPEEVGRYTRTLPRCARDGDWFGFGQLLEMKDFPKEKITGFYCESVSLTDYLVRAGGNERNFTIFLRDCQRYGTPQALKRQYGIDSPQALETAWKRSTLEVGRGQEP